MAKAQSPLLGYNTNIRHKGKVFHIQTEDSGILKPHVMTHLFADGGRILKSLKTSYANLLEAEDLSTQVKKLMQDQHKAMFLALREGQFDEVAGINVAPAPDAVESDIPTGETNTVPPAAPTPLSPNAAVVVLPPPPPRSHLPPAPSIPPAQIPVVVARPAMFGEVSISERSLDEVILAFLTEELEASGTG
jgi:hypothetical protein